MGKPSKTSALRRLVPLVGPFVVAALACGGEPDRGPPPRLVEPTPERLAALKGTPGAPDAASAAPPVEERQALTSAAELDAMVAECARDGAAAPGTAPPPDVGVVFHGNKPVSLPPMPNDGIFRTTEANPEFIDPNRIAESAGTAIVSNLFEPLLVKAAGNAPALPAAATAYDVSADGRTYTFHLRPGMVWSDGHPVTAADYAYGWKRGLDPATGSRSAQQLWIIEGAQAFNEGKTKTADQVAIEAVDDLTLGVRLNGPAPFFPDLVTYVAYSPVPRWAVEAHGDQWTRPGKIVTNGPFRLDKWLERDRVELSKSATFWDAEHIALAGVVVYLTDSEAAVRTLYDTGQTHVARPLTPDGVQQAIAEGRSDLRIDTNACVYYYALRLDHPPLDDSRVRRALNLAFDKAALVTHVLGAFQTPASGFVPPMIESFMGYRPPTMPERDPAEAARLLAAAGYPQGRGFPATSILYNTSEGHKRIAEFVSKNLQETLGITLDAQNMEWKSLLTRMQSGDFALGRSGWCADYPDPQNFLENFHSASDNNVAGYKNPAYDANLDRARGEADKAKRKAYLCGAEKALLRDMPFLLMYQYTRSILIRPEVKGHLPQYQDHHLWRWISLAPSAAPSPPGNAGGR